MTNEQKQHARALRKAGCTYQQIAEGYGVSKQYIYQLLHEVKVPRRSCAACIYPNVAAWMTAHDMTAGAIASEIGVAPETFLRAVRGDGTTKHTIDKLLAFTGMTYEEFFDEGGESNV